MVERQQELFAVARDDAEFVRGVWSYYERFRRPMPWRDDPQPYAVLVSEFMLQQTQVARVLDRFGPFVQRFPTLNALAEAPQSAVVEAWTGLGYNRRARHLHRTARLITTEYDGVLPRDPLQLQRLPGVGPNTAGSLAAFAYNEPTVFIETNIRRAVLHHFFADRTEVPDHDVRAVVERLLDHRRPRDWYYALMDYGTALRRSVPNPNRRSKHYSKQSVFTGSLREARGAIVRALASQAPQRRAQLARELPIDSDRLARALAALEREGMIVAEPTIGYRLAD